MNALSSHPYGRLLATAITLALVGGGASAAMTGLPSIMLLGLSLLGGVALSIVAIALMIEDHAELAMYAVILLPFALFLYMVGYGTVLRQAEWGGYASIGAGAVFAALVFGGKLFGNSAAPRAPSMTATAGRS
jgi:hypothetical protein